MQRLSRRSPFKRSGLTAPFIICLILTTFLAAGPLARATKAAAQPVPPAPPTVLTPPLATGPGCIIQSDFGSTSHKNFEVVVLSGSSLVHYWHDNADVRYAWHRGQVITDHATGPGCIIQSDFNKASGHGDFEVVVQEGSNLVHYWHDNTDVTSPWHRGQIITTHATGPGSIIQSDFNQGSGHGDFEVVVPEGNNLVHYWHDNTDVNSPWHQGLVITDHATGPGSIIQSDFNQASGHGDFEVVVQEGSNLVHYWHDNTDVNSPWHQGQIITTHATGPGSIIQSDFNQASGHGDFEVVVPEGSNLVHYWHDNTDVNSPWHQGLVITDHAAGPGSIIQSDFNQGSGHGDFEVVVQEGNNLVHYWHDNTDVNSPWHQGLVITYTGRSQKVCQLTGETDEEFDHPTVNQTQQADVSSVDLGFPVEQNPLTQQGPLYFLFGDTFPARTDNLNDSIAYTLDTAPPADGSCTHLQFITDPGGAYHPQQVTPSIPQGGFNVPSSGFSANGKLYTFFWTDHINLGPSDPDYLNWTQGRSVLAASDDGALSFQQVYGDPGQNFVYTSSAVVSNPDTPGLPPGPGVFVWGVSLYRQSDPHLAFIPFSSIENKIPMNPIGTTTSVGTGWYFFTGFGTSGQPQWAQVDPNAPFNDPSSDLFAATPQPCVGEMSVSWNPWLRQWIMLYNCSSYPAFGGRPAYQGLPSYHINMRVASHPWGPWSTPEVIFDPNQDSGYCHLMHVSWGQTTCDSNYDQGESQYNDPQNHTGAEYAPFIISRYTTGNALSTTIYFLLSTWEPYQVVLMKATLQEVTPPTLTLPSTIMVNATSPAGASVSYTVTATDPDNTPDQLTIHCAPSSGSTFPIGTTTVTCTASDPVGNSTQGSFQVQVNGASDQSRALITLINSFNLPQGIQQSLDAKVQTALTSIAVGDTATVCGALSDFIEAVNAQSGKKLTTDQAKQLIAAATQIRIVLGC